MLIQKLVCPFGCKNSIFGESTKTIQTGNSNLLLEGNIPQTKKIKIYSCQCCGNTFETQMTNEGRNVL